MGVSSSRKAVLPEDLDSKYEDYKKSWIESCKEFSPPNGKSTLGKDVLESATRAIRDYFIGKSRLSILEIMAGNGCASEIISNKLKTDLNIEKWTATDIQNLPQSSSIPVISECDSVEAISRYGKTHNTLLMISPPPSTYSPNGPISGYGDYFAVKKWTELDNSQYIIIIGELGASDGSEGMYGFMMSHPVWKCVERKMAYLGVDHLFGGNIEKEVFIFERSIGPLRAL
jgi:hypothetical protein